jgi:hypothetical protein
MCCTYKPKIQAIHSLASLKEESLTEPSQVTRNLFYADSNLNPDTILIIVRRVLSDGGMSFNASSFK